MGKVHIIFDNPSYMQSCYAEFQYLRYHVLLSMFLILAHPSHPQFTIIKVGCRGGGDKFLRHVIMVCMGGVGVVDHTIHTSIDLNFAQFQLRCYRQPFMNNQKLPDQWLVTHDLINGTSDVVGAVLPEANS